MCTPEATCKGPGKRGHIVADTLLPMMFLGPRKLGNICCGHRMFLNKIRNNFCVPDTKFVSATMLRAQANGETFVSATMCPQQCVLVCQGLNTSPKMAAKIDIRETLQPKAILQGPTHSYNWLSKVPSLKSFLSR